MAKRAKKTKVTAPNVVGSGTVEPASPKPDRPQVIKARSFAIDAARMLDDDQCEDVIVLDVRGLSHLSDFIVIGSGTSDRQMRSAAADVADLGRQQGHSAVRQSVDDRTTWHVVDFVDVVVHVFEPNTRAYYDIEMLWGDAARLDWKRTAADQKLKPKTRVRRASSAQREATDADED